MQEQVADLLERLNLPYWTWNILIALFAIFAGLLIKFILTITVRRQTRGNGYSLFRSLITHVGMPLNYLLPVLLFDILLPLLRVPAAWMHFIASATDIALIICFGWLLIQAMNVTRDFVLHKYDYDKEDNLKERRIRTQLQFIGQITKGIVILLTIAAVLLNFSAMRKIGTGLLTGVGIGGIIIGFAAQKSLGNLLAGFQIAFTQPIRLDDAVIVEGEYGKIEEITLTYVVVSLWDERRLILPINYFIEKPFQNWTRTSTELIGSVMLYADYSLPIESVRQELTRLLKANPLWDGRVNSVQVTDATEKVIQIRALMSARNASQAFDLRCYIRENLVLFINRQHPDSFPRTRTEFGTKTESDKLPEPSPGKTDRQSMV